LISLERKYTKISKFKALVLVSFISAFVFNACSGSSGSDLDPVPVKDIKDRVNRNSMLIETMEASGNIAFDSPEQSGQGWIEVKIKKPDSVFVRIEGPFGISIAQALITRYDFIYYNVQENKAILGPTTDINIGAVLRIKVSFDELLSGFSGGFIFENSSIDSVTADSEKGLYTIKTNSTPGIQKYYIDPSIYTVNKYNSFDGNNKTVVEVDYSNYFEENASGNTVYFPSSIKIRNPEKKQSVYVDYVNKSFNKQDLKFTIKIPKSAKVTKWD
jgi:hypothetical protein